MDDMDGGEIDERRGGSGVRPQHLLLTLLGDYWYQREEPLPSGALVDLLAEFGISEQNARAAISRLNRRGLLESLRHGRATRYRLSGQGSATLAEGTDRIFGFGRTTLPWDGTWTCVSFSIPESLRSTRTTLRTRLRWLGFAPVYDAAWFAPGDRADAAAGVISELEVKSATIITGPIRDAGDGDPLRAWDLAELGSRYEAFICRFASLRDRIGRVGHTEALTARTALIDEWRTFPGLDPELPAELLPGGWPQKPAVDLFVAVYDALGPLATRRVKEIIARHDPQAAALAAHHTTQDVAPGAEPGRR
ncbi:PaaX family transcriptional regulator C-terminal domain-containing protein [Nonomuraea sp. NPDC005650]|uniref:PaaX family transcriptional regulator n=1 Tax=Nonomuraea sp. NPDC005650 TaxID=3157045 RepID=UPI0033AA9889